ncbi:MAG TPA: hypothetical protein VH114_08635 [Candidatus Acidoferrum sp.]|nr:hypothetical protein [Candidatus Acidoferrum sp.]
MPEAKTLYRIFEHWLPQNTQLAVVREALHKEDRPSALRSKSGYLHEGEAWVREHRSLLTPVLLRHVDLPDELIAGLVSDGDILVPSKGSSEQTIVFSVSADATKERQVHLSFGLTHVAACSVFLFQLFIDICAANQPCGIQMIPPEINLSPGSLQVTVGGGLFSSGLGLLVACAAGLTGTPTAPVMTRVALESAGVVEWVLGWRKAAAETQKTFAEATKTDAEKRLLELDIRVKELELERAKLKGHVVGDQDEFGRSTRVNRRCLESRAESSEVPRNVVQQHAERIELSESYANHVLNRALPSARFMKQKMAGIEVKSSISTTPRRRAHGSSS